MLSRSPLWGAVALCAVLHGCMSMDAPADFLALRAPGDEFKATTAEAARLWVRAFADDDRGDLAFWSRALHNDLVDNRGYAPLEALRGEVVDGAGNAGSWRAYDVRVEGQALRYLVALFVPSPGEVVVAEFLAPAAEFDARREAVLAALRTLRP